MNILIPITLLSILMQCAAALLALRLIRITGKTLGWSLICVALGLMIIRRAFVLLFVLVPGNGPAPDLPVETISLLISAFMLVGMLMVEPLFRSMQLMRDRVLQQSEQLQQVNHDLESFAYTLTHDLKAPLRRIAGYTQMLGEDCHDQLKPDSREWLVRIESNAREMDRLIESVLLFSRSGFAPVTRSVVDVSSMAATLLEELKKAEPQRAVQTESEPGITVFADPALVHVVLQNLVGNAWKFTRTREVAKITVRAAHLKGEAAFSVADNGVGFSPDSVSKLFQPFTRQHTETEFAGFGIGLATVKRIVDRHGGSIQAIGELDHGATMTCSFGPDASAEV